MKNVILGVSNSLDNDKLIAEDKLDKVLQDTTLTLDMKIEKSKELLREVALSDISANLWRSYITQPEPEAKTEGEMEVVEGTDQKEDK
jgi:hypothetical protein